MGLSVNPESKGDYRILVCVPAFNEAKTIVEIINRLKNADGVMVYDGATDDTYDPVVSAGARLLRVPQILDMGLQLGLFQAAQ